eukprot:scaffold44167_cov85-Phaeocystis_antarctica.AAC.1
MRQRRSAQRRRSAGTAQMPATWERSAAKHFGRMRPGAAHCQRSTHQPRPRSIARGTYCAALAYLRASQSRRSPPWSPRSERLARVTHQSS